MNSKAQQWDSQSYKGNSLIKYSGKVKTGKSITQANKVKTGRQNTQGPKNKTGQQGQKQADQSGKHRQGNTGEFSRNTQDTLAGTRWKWRGINTEGLMRERAAGDEMGREDQDQVRGMSWLHSVIWNNRRVSDEAKPDENKLRVGGIHGDSVQEFTN